MQGDVPPTPGNIKRLQEKKEKLLEDKHFRQGIVRQHAVKIKALWDQLSIKEAEREAFFSRHSGLGPAVLDAVRTPRGVSLREPSSYEFCPRSAPRRSAWRTSRWPA